MLKLKIICILFCLVLFARSQTAEMPQYEGVAITLQAEEIEPGRPVELGVLLEARQAFVDRLHEAGVGYVSAWVADSERLQLDVRRPLVGLNKIMDALQPGLLEVLDGGDNPPAVGEYVNTDLGSPSPEAIREALMLSGATRTPSPATKFLHDIVTGSEIDTGSIEVKGSSDGLSVVRFRVKVVPIDDRRHLTPNDLEGYVVIALGNRVVGVSKASWLEPGEMLLTRLRPDEAQRLAGFLRRGGLPIGFHVADTRKLPGTPVVEGWR